MSSKKTPLKPEESGDSPLERVASGMGADVTVLDRNPAMLDHLDRRFGPAISTQD